MANLSENPSIVILDLDECLVQVGLYSIILKSYKQYNRYKAYPDPNFSIKHIFEGHGMRPGAFRPGLKELIQVCRRLLDEKKLDELVVYTSASDANGWVNYILECIEVYANVPPNTINRYIAREHHFNPARDGGGIKDMTIVVDSVNYPMANKSIKNCIMVDDRIYNIEQSDNPTYKHNVFEVAPYRQYVSPYRFLRACVFWDSTIESNIRAHSGKVRSECGQFHVEQQHLQHATGMIMSEISNDAMSYPHPVKPVSYANDCELFKIIGIIKTIYDKG